MKGRAGVMLALVAMLAAAVASTAGAGSSAVTASQAVNCNGTLKIGIITPLITCGDVRSSHPPPRCPQ